MDFPVYLDLVVGHSDVGANVDKRSADKTGTASTLQHGCAIVVGPAR